MVLIKEKKYVNPFLFICMADYCVSDNTITSFGPCSPLSDQVLRSQLTFVENFIQSC